MQLSTDRILTTHTGSLPRPESMLGPGAGPEALATASPEAIAEAVAETVRRQVEAGVDVINDGEVSKPGYATYISTRLSGFGGTGKMEMPADMLEFPEFAMRRLGDPEAMKAIRNPACVGPVSYVDTGPLERDIANLQAEAKGSGAADVFMSAASPGVIAMFQENQHYAGEEEYLGALADAMKTEYDAIHAAGFVLQLDCPDLPSCGVLGPPMEREVFRRKVALHIEAINHATRDIPADSMRLHLCWGNYEGPHHRDVPLADIIDLVFEARPMAVSFEAANPRHSHEWTLFEDMKLPDDKVLIPGVLDTTTNYIEHPELVAQRIERYARLVGQEHVIAGSDCGFATFARFLTIDPKITWAKLAVMAEGAELASRRLRAA